MNGNRGAGHLLCPFCGGLPEISGESLTYCDYVDSWPTFIRCQSCGAKSASVTRFFDDDHKVKIAEAWQNWDRRTPHEGNNLSNDIEVSNAQIKPLQWTKHVHDNGEETYTAESVIGRYAAWIKEGSAKLIIPGNANPVVIGTSMEDAYSHASNDIRRRILSAINLSD